MLLEIFVEYKSKSSTLVDTLCIVKNMTIHGFFDVGKVAEILDCNEEASYVDEDVLSFLLQDGFDPSVSELNASTSTDIDEVLREIAIALQEEQKPLVLHERKARFKTLTEQDRQTI